MITRTRQDTAIFSASATTSVAWTASAFIASSCSYSSRSTSPSYRSAKRSRLLLVDGGCGAAEARERQQRLASEPRPVGRTQRALEPRHEDHRVGLVDLFRDVNDAVAISQTAGRDRMIVPKS